MELKGSKTEANLMAAFAGESQARNKYTYYASKAKKEGYEQIAALFQETADNEKEHAKMWFKLLQGGQIKSTAENLKDAAAGENYEWTDMYAGFAKIAKEEGFDQAAGAFDMIAKVEAVHGRRFALLAELLGKNQYFENPDGGEWMCMNCGHIQKGKMAPPVCPSCHYDRGYFIPVELAPYLMPELI